MNTISSYNDLRTTDRTTRLNKKKKMPVFTASSQIFCGPAGIRTLDPMIKSHLLYQLSYRTFFPFGGAKIMIPSKKTSPKIKDSAKPYETCSAQKNVIAIKNKRPS